MSEVRYLEDVVKGKIEAKETETPRFYSASGYGRKIPTRFMVKVENRWHRVYAICFSNAASLYTVVGKKQLFIKYDETLKGELK